MLQSVETGLLILRDDSFCIGTLHMFIIISIIILC